MAKGATAEAAVVEKSLEKEAPAVVKDILVQKDVILAFGESARIFIHYLSTTANDICKESKKQTINADDVLKAIDEIEFPEFIELLKTFLDEYRRRTASKRFGAMTKASRSEKKQKSFEHDGASPGKIFIGGLPKDTTLHTFLKYFGKYDHIIDSMIMKNRHTNQLRGFGFITYEDPSVVDQVMEDTHVINEKQIEIKRTIPKGSAQTKDLKTKKIFVGRIPTIVEMSKNHNRERKKLFFAVISYTPPAGRGLSGRGEGHEITYCSYCDYLGHTSETCYFLHSELRPLRVAKIVVTDDISTVFSSAAGLIEEYVINLVKNILRNSSSVTSSSANDQNAVTLQLQKYSRLLETWDTCWIPVSYSDYDLKLFNGDGCNVTSLDQECNSKDRHT